MTTAAGRTTRTLNGAKLLWADAAGTVHLCELAAVHPGVRLVWTLCGVDVPAGAAFTSAETATCLACMEVERGERA